MAKSKLARRVVPISTKSAPPARNPVETIEESWAESTNRWPRSRYETLDGRASEAQTLIEDATKEIVGIYLILNRDLSYAVTSHSEVIAKAKDVHKKLREALDAVALLGGELDSLGMLAGKAVPDAN